MISTIIIARVLGPISYGLFTLTLVSSSIFATVLHGSLGYANIHFAMNAPTTRPALIGNSIAISFIWGGLATITIGALFSGVRQQYYPLLTDRFWVITLLAIIPLLLNEFSSGIVAGMSALRRLNMTLLGKELSFLFLIVLLFQAGEATAFTFTSLWLVMSFIGALLVLFQAIKLSEKNPCVEIDTFVETIKYGIHSHFVHLVSTLRLPFDFLLIGLFLTLADVGFYAVSIVFIIALWSLPTLIIPLLQKRFLALGFETGLELSALLVRTSFMGVVVVAFLFALLGRIAIILLPGPAYLLSFTPLLLLLPGAVIFSLYQIIIIIETPVTFEPNNTVFIFAFILNLILSVLLIPKFGIIGAAASSSIASSFVGLLFLNSFLSESGLSIKEVLLLKSEDLNLIFRRDY